VFTFVVFEVELDLATGVLCTIHVRLKEVCMSDSVIKDTTETIAIMSNADFCIVLSDDMFYKLFI